MICRHFKVQGFVIGVSWWISCRRNALRSFFVMLKPDLFGVTHVTQQSSTMVTTVTGRVYIVAGGAWSLKCWIVLLRNSLSPPVSFCTEPAVKMWCFSFSTKQSSPIKPQYLVKNNVLCLVLLFKIYFAVLYKNVTQKAVYSAAATSDMNKLPNPI